MERHRTVVIVEDDDDIRDSLVEAIGEQGYRTVAVPDGLAALAALPTVEPPCVIVLDLKMPRMNGREFLQALRADDRWTSFRVLIASADRKTDTLPPGFSAFLPKPFSLEALLELLEQTFA